MRRDFIFDEFYFNFNLINFTIRQNFPFTWRGLGQELPGLELLYD